MGLIDCTRGFELDEDEVLTQEVGPKRRDRPTPEPGLQFDLTFDAEALVSESNVIAAR